MYQSLSSMSISENFAASSYAIPTTCRFGYDILAFSCLGDSHSPLIALGPDVPLLYAVRQDPLGLLGHALGSSIFVC